MANQYLGKYFKNYFSIEGILNIKVFELDQNLIQTL